jgi:hypothetical protein
MGALESRFEGRMDAMESRLKTYVDERCEKVETTFSPRFTSGRGPMKSRRGPWEPWLWV